MNISPKKQTNISRLKQKKKSENEKEESEFFEININEKIETKILNLNERETEKILNRRNLPFPLRTPFAAEGKKDWNIMQMQSGICPPLCFSSLSPSIILSIYLAIMTNKRSFTTTNY